MNSGRFSASPRARAAFVAFFILVGVIACGSSSTDNAIAHADLAKGCIVNSDCKDPLVCAFKSCHDKCDTSRDCPDKELCVQSDRPFHVCQLPVEKDCATNAQCPTGQTCGVDSQCRDVCRTER